MDRFPLILVTLNPGQIAKAKEINGKPKRITHALLCGPYGQIFGTEKHCLKYFSVWVKIFPTLFSRGVTTDVYEIVNFKTTFDLVNKLIEAEEAPKTTRRRSAHRSECVPKNQRAKHKNAGRSGCLALVLAVLFLVHLKLANSMPFWV